MPSAGIGGLVLVAAAALGLGTLAGCGGTPAGEAPTSTVTAYVTDTADNGDTPGIGTVIPVNLADQTPGTPIALGPGEGTNDIIVTSDGTTAYVTNE